MSDVVEVTPAEPRFQFSLADVFAALVSLAYPVLLISEIDLEELDRPEGVAVAVGFGLVLGFFLAIQYRRLWNSRAPWIVPPFLIFFWSLFLLPFGPWPWSWQSVAALLYICAFCSVTLALRNQKRGGRYPILVGSGGLLVGFLLWGVFQRPMVTPRRAVNEWSASTSIKALAEAQEIYRRTDYDKDGVPEYAASMQDLFETTPGAADLMLIDPMLAGADATLASPRPSSGYLFRLLTAQSANQPAGTKPWFDAKGNLVGGFAFVAYPAQYKRSGRNTFLFSGASSVRQKDLGPDTDTIVKAMTVFDPDTSWTPSE